MVGLVRGVGAAAPTGLVTTFDGTGGAEKRLTPAQVSSSKDTVLKQTVKNAERVMTFLHDRFGRNGLDNAGAGMQLVVHAPDPRDGDPQMNNAYWDTQRNRMYIGDGDGSTFSPLGLGVDVIAHETGHAVLASEVHMSFDGQQGALHESFGDVLGVLVDDGDWKIGEDVFTPDEPGDALRDISKPQKYSNLEQVRSPDVDPHLLADIPNLAAYRVAQKLGRQAMGDIWYHGFTEQLRDHGNFTDAAAATVKAAQLLYGDDSKNVNAVRDAWQSVGVLPAGLTAKR